MSFHASDITKIAGVKRTRLQQWLERGYIVPSIRVAEGSGDRNIYSYVDLYNIAIFKKVSEMGFSRKVVADMLSKGAIGQDWTYDELSKRPFYIYIRWGDKSHSALIDSKKIYFDYVLEQLGWDDMDDCYLINFQKIKKSVDEKAREFRKDLLEEFRLFFKKK